MLRSCLRFSPSFTIPCPTAELERSRGVAECKLSAEAQRAIETVLARGDRVEVIPTKDGVKIVRIRREEVGR